MTKTPIATLIARITRTVVETATAAPHALRNLRTHTPQPATPAPAPLLADDITGGIPAITDIEQAACDYDTARADTNAAARLRRRAEKVLKRTPDGVHGAVTVVRFESTRQTADLEAIRAIFAAHGLGDVPMRRCAPSLTITWAAEAAPELASAA